MFVTILIGAVIGAALAVGVIINAFEVETKESGKASRQISVALRSRVYVLTAENAKLRLSLAAGEMTEDGKTIAATAIAALDAVHAEAEEAVLGSLPGLAASRKLARDPEDKE